jgi:hypothetical protein
MLLNEKATNEAYSLKPGSKRIDHPKRPAGIPQATTA